MIGDCPSEEGGSGHMCCRWASVPDILGPPASSLSASTKNGNHFSAYILGEINEKRIRELLNSALSQSMESVQRFTNASLQSVLRVLTRRDPGNLLHNGTFG